MSTKVQFRRGNTSQTSAFTGAVAEITVDTDKNVVVVHDGITSGGHPLTLDTKSQAAFDKANAAYDAANSDLSLIAGELASNVEFIAAVNATQNTAIGLLEAVNNTQNTSISILQSVDNTQNTNIQSVEDLAQAAFNTANSAGSNEVVVASYAHANAAYDQANTNAGNITTIQAVNATQNTNISAVDTKAQSAFDSGNTTLTYAQAGYAKANADGVLAQAAFDSANNVAPQIAPSFAHANAAYDQANTGTNLAQSAFDHSNNTLVFAEYAYSLANTNATDITYVQEINNLQNSFIETANTNIQAAFDLANTTSSDLSTANTFLQANDALTLSVSKTYTDTSIANLVNSAPSTLDTLKELADALASDPNFATTVSTNIGVVRNHANAAYDQANTNAGAITVIQSVNNTQNTSITVLQDVNVTQNSRLTGVETFSQSSFNHANSAYDKANSANVLAQASFDHANLAITIGNTATYLGSTNTSIDGLSSVGFNAAAGYTVGQGQVAWNATDRTFDMGLYGGSVLQVGQETHMLIKANNNISNGQTVMFVGVNGNNILGDVCDTSVPGFINDYFIGVATQNITKNDFGYVTLYGKIRGLNTLGHLAGDILWVDNNNPGALTTTVPAIGTPHIRVAAVIKISGGNGEIMVRPTTKDGLDELYDIGFTSLTNGDVLQYNGSVWVNSGNLTSLTTYSQAGFTHSNTTLTYAQASYDKANADGVLAQAAFDSGNTTLTYSQTGFAHANSSYDKANASGILAQASFDAGNTTTTYSQVSFAHANSAYNKANTSGTVAQAAFDTANTKFSSDGGTINGNVNVLGDINATGNISYSGSVTSVNITGNTGQFWGYAANGFNALYAGLPAGQTELLPNEVAEFTAANNSYVQINFQNQNGGTKATTDWIATANNGTDTTYYVDLGIAGSGYDNTSPDNSLGTSLFPNDSYLYAQGDTTAGQPGGNLVIGTTTVDKVVKIIAGGHDSENVVTTFAPTDVQFTVPVAGDLIINANTSFNSSNISLGTVANVHLYGGNTGQLLSTDNVGNLEWIDLPTPNTITYTANSLNQTNGVYVSGNLWSTTVFGDYATSNGAYVLTDGSGSAPAWYIDFDFINVVKFNRVVLNINYTQASGHTVYVQLYNQLTSAWDNIGTYTGLGSYYAFALEVIDETNYVDTLNKVQLRLYHSNGGNTAHQTSIDYVALEQSYQGPQGPRGPTGSTGATGATGPGVATGGTAGQVLVKNSSTNYDTSWSNNLIDSYNKANSATVLAQAAFDASNTESILSSAINATQNTNISNASATATDATVLAQSAYASGNTNSSSITVLQSVNTTQNTRLSAVETLSQSAFNSGNTTLTYAQAGYAKANADGVLAQASFDSSNTKFSSSGGTISGDTVVSGNLTVNGTTFYANTVNLRVEDNIITLNSNVTGSPTLDSGIEVNRGSSTNTALIWKESAGAWQFTNDGTTYDKIAGLTYANAAYAQANTNASAITVLQAVNTTQNTNTTAASTLAQAAFDKANTDYTTISTTSGIYGGSASIPVITLAANGRVSSIVNTAITTGTTITEDSSTNGGFFPIFTDVTTGTISSANVSYGLSYNPSQMRLDVGTSISINGDTGTVTATDVNTTSDAQFKENVETIQSPLGILNSINGVSFNWKDSGNKSYGVIAQELQKVLPELVKQDDRGLSVSYIPLIAILIEAIKEQQKQIDELKK